MKKAITKLAWAILWLGTKVITVEPRVYKRGGTYVLVQDLKLCGITVDTVEDKVKDLVSEEK